MVLEVEDVGEGGEEVMDLVKVMRMERLVTLALFMSDPSLQHLQLLYP